MAVGEICNREAVVAPRGCTLLEAARLMRQHHVGDVVVEIMAPAIDQTVITWAIS